VPLSKEPAHKNSFNCLSNMSYQRIPTRLYEGREDDLLLVSRGGKEENDRIWNHLMKTLPEKSQRWEQIKSNGRRRLTLGPKGTGLIGGRNKITPSHSWEGKEWKILREFVQQRTRELISLGHIPENSQPNALVNYYPNGSSSISYHHDKTDNCLGTVASFTFGPKDMCRQFLLRNVASGNEYSIPLRHGDWLIMGGTTNENFQHAIQQMKKNQPGWELARYNISIRFLTPIKTKKIKQYQIECVKQDNGCYGFKQSLGAKHPMSGLQAVPVDLVPFTGKFLIRFKNWGNVGSIETNNRKIISLSREKWDKGVKLLPDFYFSLPNRQSWKLLVDTFRQLQSYFLWRFPRGSRFTDRKVEFRDIVDIIFLATSGDNRFQVPSNFREGIQSVNFQLASEMILSETPSTSRRKKTKKIITQRFGFKVCERELLENFEEPPEKKGIVWARKCILDDGREMPGLNMQYPFSRMLFGGLGQFAELPVKSVETRTWKMNEEKYFSRPIAIIETPGPKGRKVGIKKARIIGVVKFNKTITYSNDLEWKDDQNRHQCPFNLAGETR
jgi:hypothetical protein